jgi:hypothetical protein
MLPSPTNNDALAFQFRETHAAIAFSGVRQGS